jgi:hypothetical protein
VFLGVTVAPPVSAQTHTCTLGSGSHAELRSGAVTVSLPISGHQDLVFSPSDANGVRTISIPPSGTHYDCVTLPLNTGIACPRPDPSTEGHGRIDCNGTAGTSGYNVTAEQDHDSNNGDNPGFDPDPSCTATFTEPDGPTMSAVVENGSADHPHSGVCNSPIHIAESGTFPAGGMLLHEHLILRLIRSVTSCSASACPADTTPFDASAGDVAYFPVVTTGAGRGTIFDPNNSSESPLVADTSGAPQSCASIDAGNLSGGTMAGVLPSVDVQQLGDSNVVFQIQCQ